MKTTAIIFAAALLFGFASCQKDTIAPDNATPATLKTSVDMVNDATLPEAVLVRYDVTVNYKPTGESTLCNVYFVVILDGNGKTIDSQPFIPGTSNYSLTETTRNIRGTRIARLETGSGPVYDCPSNLYALPDIQKLEFKNEATFFFTLNASSNPPKSKN